MLILLSSCSETIKQQNSGTTWFPWNFSDKQFIQDIVDSVYFIPIEAHPDGLFKRADKLIIKNSKIFIYDMLGQNQVLVFDLSGRFLYRVGRRGIGTGEYIQMRNFTVDDNYIYIIDNRTQKILLYEISNGTYISEIKLPFIVHDMEVAGNGDFVCAQQKISGETQPKKYAYNMFVTSRNMEIKTSLFPFKENDCDVWSQFCYLKTTDKHIVFHTMVADSVVLLNRDFPSEQYLVYNMDFGDKTVPRNMKINKNLDMIAQSEKYNEYRFLSSTPEINVDYIVGEYWHDSSIGVYPYIYDIKKQKVYVNEYGGDNMNKFLFQPLFHIGDTVVAMYGKDYHHIWKISDFPVNLPESIKQHLDKDNDVLIKYVLK
jgi:hypothetical protein